MTESSYKDHVWHIQGWTHDMCKALYERPLWARLLLRLAMGRYAYREFLGVIEYLKKGWWNMDLGYDPLQTMDYHNEPMPLDYKPAMKRD